MYRCSSCGALNRVSASHPQGAPICGRCKSALELSGAPQEVDAAAFERAIAAPVPVLVDFWAPWCGPCRAVAPILEAYARSQAGKLIVLKLNTDEHPELSGRLGILGIPTMIVFRGGAEQARRSGAMPAPELARWLSPLLEGGDATHA